MSDINRTRTFFIREETPLPTTLSIESEAFLPGWRVVKNLDRQALTREVEGANWNFFYLAGEIRATVLGRDLLSTLRRVVKRVLAKQEGQKFNSLEITKVVSKRFLGIPFMSVTAHSRHIQRGIGLVRESKDENFGFNAETGEFGDLVKAGVIDPAKVTRLARQNAASIAALMLTTEALVADIKDEGQKAAAGAGHGGGGMGGTY